MSRNLSIRLALASPRRHVAATVLRDAGETIAALLAPLARVPSMSGLLVVCLLALCARAVVSFYSFGSNDIETWRMFGQLVATHGVVRVYELDPLFNHPPLMGYYGAAVHWLTQLSGIRFSVMFKVVPILASVATVFAVQRSTRLSYGVLLLFALNPIDVLISAYHGNTDSLCSALCVASVLLANKGMVFRAGLALAAAHNVKLVPVILVAPLLVSLNDRKAMLRFGLGLMLGVLPFLPPLWRIPDEFVHNTIRYNSLRSHWGLGLLAYGTAYTFPDFSRELWIVLGNYAKNAILAASVVTALCQVWLRAFSRWELCAFPFLIFLVFAPGFGPQYLVYPTVFLLLSNVRTGLGYSYLAGAFAAILYHGFWNRMFPAYSPFRAPDLHTVLIGFLLWVVLAWYLYADCKRLLAAARAWVVANSGRVGRG